MTALIAGAGGGVREPVAHRGTGGRPGGGGEKDARAQGFEVHPSDRKTAALLTASIRLGAMSANAPEKKLQALTDFGQALGLAFQVIDDILDVTQTSEKLGKSAGKDVAAQKATYPSVFGLEKSGRRRTGSRTRPTRRWHPSVRRARFCGTWRIFC